MTRAQIEAQLRSELADGIVVSVNGKIKTILPGSPEYEQRIAEMTEALFAKQMTDAAAAREEQLTQTAKAAYAALNAGTATAAQTQKVVAWLLRQQVTDLKTEFPV
jgi:ribosome-binding ATPase YchF (GTP1/OBG family)